MTQEQRTRWPGSGDDSLAVSLPSTDLASQQREEPGGGVRGPEASPGSRGGTWQGGHAGGRLWKTTLCHKGKRDDLLPSRSPEAGCASAVLALR